MADILTAVHNLIAEDIQLRFGHFIHSKSSVLPYVPKPISPDVVYKLSMSGGSLEEKEFNIPEHTLVLVQDCGSFVDVYVLFSSSTALMTVSSSELSALVRLESIGSTPYLNVYDAKALASLTPNGLTRSTLLFPYYVTDILPFAFRDSHITEFIADFSLKYIGDHSFSDLQYLNFVNLSRATSITTIREETFSGCKALQKIILPPFTKRIDKWAFAQCISLSEIYNTSYVTELGPAAFSGAALTKYYGNSVVTLESSVFAFCSSLTLVDLSNAISLPATLFANSGLIHLIVSDSLKSVDASAFASCFALNTITFYGSRDYFNSVFSPVLLTETDFRNNPAHCKKVNLFTDDKSSDDVVYIKI